MQESLPEKSRVRVSLEVVTIPHIGLQVVPLVLSPFCSEFDEADEYCPGCDNHYYVEAKEEEKKVSSSFDQKFYSIESLFVVSLHSFSVWMQ